ncbi:hypothetical protein T492DRAFT_860975 [Pavlovales sp. CCMP2436]|nr:hypothetical protein T492DRAFT_860975 [Pavlovales sp. CCMP2436]
MKTITKVRWLARPDQRSLFARLKRSTSGGPSQTLAATLKDVQVCGRSPSTAREWERVESRLELAAAAASLRAQWTVLGAFVAAPALPPPDTLEPHAHGPAAALGAWSSRECAAALARLRAALRLGGPELCAARAQQAAMLGQLDLIEPGRGGGPSAGPTPTGRLRNEAMGLSDVRRPVESAVSAFLQAQARLREARASLAHLQALGAVARGLRAPGWAAHLLRPDPSSSSTSSGACPADARRLWAAAAAMSALRAADRRDTAATRGVSAALRLTAEREAAVCALVGA